MLACRYAEHAPYWQFVVWGRQLLLTIDYLIPSFVLRTLDFGVGGGGGGDDDDADAALGLSVANRTNGGGGGGGPAAAPPHTHDLGELSLVWVHSLAAVAILGLFWRLHARIKPYHFAFQNRIEHLLFATDVLVVSLATLYTALSIREVPATARLLIEVLLLLTLIGSLLAVAGMLLHSARHGARSQTQKDADEERLALRERACLLHSSHSALRLTHTPSHKGSAIAAGAGGAAAGAGGGAAGAGAKTTGECDAAADTATLACGARPASARPVDRWVGAVISAVVSAVRGRSPQEDRLEKIGGGARDGARDDARRGALSGWDRIAPSGARDSLDSSSLASFHSGAAAERARPSTPENSTPDARAAELHAYQWHLISRCSISRCSISRCSSAMPGTARASAGSSAMPGTARASAGARASLSTPVPSTARPSRASVGGRRLSHAQRPAECPVRRAQDGACPRMVIHRSSQPGQIYAGGGAHAAGGAGGAGPSSRPSGVGTSGADAPGGGAGGPPTSRRPSVRPSRLHEPEGRVSEGVAIWPWAARRSSCGATAARADSIAPRGGSRMSEYI